MNRWWALLAAGILAGVIGGATTSQAATSFSVSLSPLIGTTTVNEIPQVTLGGKIGLHLVVQNSGTSAAQHAVILVTSDVATFSDSNDPSDCAVNPNDSHQFVCIPFGGTLPAGATFDVKMRYTAPSTPGVVTTTAALTIAAQTVGGGNNQGTTLAQSDPVYTNVVEDTTRDDTYLHANENAATGKLNATTHPQNFSAHMPPTLLGDPFGVAVSIHDEVGTPICDSCLPAWTELTIPTAHFANQLGNPFSSGTSTNPYDWTTSAQYPPGFRLTRLVHVDDNGIPTDVVSCASIGGAPTVFVPVCWDTFRQVASQKLAFAAGRALENGEFGFG